MKTNQLTRHVPAIAATALLLGACGPQASGPSVENSATSAARPAQWVLEDRDSTLAFAEDSGEAAIRLACPGQGELIVNVPAFEPVASEERMTFGQGGTAQTLVADPSGDERLGGVSARGPVPDNLEELAAGRLAANYGAQDSGPHPPVPAELAERFAKACRATVAAEKPAANETVSACLVQDGDRIPEMALRAVGTEPFWAARIVGRCVTYSTPEDQSGTRIWTRFEGSRDSGSWQGFHQDSRFVLRTRPQPGCSDGMSDKSYPIAVALSVGGEERTGCAEIR